MYSMRSAWLAALVIATTAGCTSTPYLDSRFGDAVNAAKAQQTLNPDALRNTDPVAGLDGTPAKHSIDEYHKTFQVPAKTFEIFLGTTGGGGR